MEVYSNNTFLIDKDELNLLIKGKFTTQVCHNCNGKGWYWVCGETGSMVDKKIDEYSYEHECEECTSLGFFIKYY